MSHEGDQARARAQVWRHAPGIALQVILAWLGAVMSLVVVAIWPHVVNSWLFLFIVGCFALLWTQLERYASWGWPRYRHLVVPMVLTGVAAWRLFMHIEHAVI